MLHEVFTLDRPFIVPDVETTGLDPQTDRIVELAFQVFTSEGLTKEWRSLINPGIPIPEAISKIHGITDSQMKLCQVCKRSKEECSCAEFHVVPTFDQLAANLAKGFSGCDFGGKNVRFDLRFISAAMKRARVAWSYIDARVIDADRLEQIGEPRHLSNLYEKHTGKTLVNAHHAMADVQATTEVIACQMRKYSVLPRSLDLLHEIQWPGWIDPEGKFRFIGGEACFGPWGKHANKPMNHSEVNKLDWRGENYWDFILKSDFSADVKELANRAKMGNFPVAKGTA